MSIHRLSLLRWKMYFSSATDWVARCTTQEELATRKAVERADKWHQLLKCVPESYLAAATQRCRLIDLSPPIIPESPAETA